MGRTRVHVAVGLDYLAQVIQERGNRGFVTQGGKALPKAEALAAVAEKKAQGFMLWPPCDNVAADGQCKGHPVEPQGR